MATQKQKFITDGSQVNREMDKMRKALVKQREEMKKITQASRSMATQAKKSNQTMRRGFSNIASGAESAIKSYVGLQTAVSAVNSVLADQKRLQGEALNVSTSVARSQAAIVKNIGQVSKTELNSFLDQVEKINTDTKFGDQGQLNLAASSLLSGTGGNQNQTIDILREAAPFFRDAPAQLASFSGAVADVQKATGGSAKETLGLVLGIQGQARIDRLDALKNLAPAVAQSRVYTEGANRGEETRQAGALFAAIGAQTGDVEGASTSTAVIALQKKLEETFPSLDGFQDKLKAIREADVTTREEFLKAGFEAKAAGVIRELITDTNSQTSKNLDDALSKITSSPKRVDEMRSLLIGGTKELELQGIQKSGKTAKEQYLESTGMAPLAEARNQAVEALAATRARNLASSSLNFMAESVDMNVLSGSTPTAQIDAFIEQLTTRQQQVQNRFSMNPFGSGIDENDRREQLKLLRSTVEELKKLRSQAAAATGNRNQEETQ